MCRDKTLEARGRGKWEVTCRHIKKLLIKVLLELDRVGAYTNSECSNYYWTVYLKMVNFF